MPYKLKEVLIGRIHELIKIVAPSEHFEINYPIALVLFNIYHYDKTKFGEISQGLGFSKDKIVKINRLKRLLRINI